MTIHDIKEKGMLLFECISGSKAYGLDTPHSDTDIRGVFYLPKEMFYGMNNNISQISDETNDVVYYELGRFVNLLIKNNPNILELLATPDDCVLYRHPLMNKLKLEMFLSKRCINSFAGYAFSQVNKARGLNKKIVNPVDKVRLSVLDFCYVIQGYSSVVARQWLEKQGLKHERCGLAAVPHAKGLYALFYDNSAMLGYRGIVTGEMANDVSLSDIPKGEKELANLFFNKDGYSSYCREYREYWEWVEKRNDERYCNTMQHGKNYDSKNMMHTIRLLQVAEEILNMGQLHVRRPNREELLSIRAGIAEYDELVKRANDLMVKIEATYTTSLLPETPDEEAIDKILTEMRMELYAESTTFTDDPQ